MFYILNSKQILHSFCFFFFLGIYKHKRYNKTCNPTVKFLKFIFNKKKYRKSLKNTFFRLLQPSVMSPRRAMLAWLWVTSRKFRESALLISLCQIHPKKKNHLVKIVDLIFRPKMEYELVSHLFSEFTFCWNSITEFWERERERERERESIETWLTSVT